MMSKVTNVSKEPGPVQLDANSLLVASDEETLFKLVLRVAQHQVVPRDWPSLADRDLLWIAEWVAHNCRAIEMGERPLQWRKLKQILADFDCTWAIPPGKGNRLNITQQVETRGLLGSRRKRSFITQVKFADDGREAMRSAIHQIRRELWLDQEHEMDSAAFYGKAPYSVDDFIAHYRKTLRRLARL